jgi:hypothetical protein
MQVTSTQSLWLRYAPGVLATFSAVILIKLAPEKWRVHSVIFATGVGLCAMEAEYWIAHGFPWPDMPFFAVAITVTLGALASGERGGLVLGIAGLSFFTYVNNRYFAPYMLDYVLPALYVLLIAISRRKLKWFRPGFFAIGVPEAIWWAAENAVAIWKTTVWHKWGWLTGQPW